MAKRPSAETWSSIRAEREASGVPFRKLSVKFGVSSVAIFKRAKSEGWSDGLDLEEVIRRKVNEKVNGIQSRDSPAKKAAAVEGAVDEKVTLLKRHRQEWIQVGAMTQEAVQLRATDPDGAARKAKLVKIIAEITKIKQEGERKAWGLDVTIDPAQLRAMTDEQLQALADGRAH